MSEIVCVVKEKSRCITSEEVMTAVGAVTVDVTEPSEVKRWKHCKKIVGLIMML